jgi:alginate O-acetyltransferase complex protein AlgJ
MKYKYAVKLTLLLTSLSIGVIPLVNYVLTADKSTFKFTQSSLFNVDPLISVTQNLLSGINISLSPEKAYFGKDGWLFVGDSYTHNVSARRQEASENELLRAQRLIKGLNSWANYSKVHGVEAFQVMMGPDKESVYSELLPSWAKPHKNNRTRAIFDAPGSEIIYDPTQNLRDYKSSFNLPLYFKTDTHWNNLGGWLVYRDFFDFLVSSRNLSIRRIPDSSLQHLESTNFESGDLARMLKIKFYSEWVPRVLLDKVDSLDVQRINYSTGEILGQKGNPRHFPLSEPVLIKNKNALNEARVLWLRDSFGSAIANLFAGTFTEVLQMHYHNVNQESLVEFIANFKPNYIFITGVERQLLTSMYVGLRDLPPQFSILQDTELYEKLTGKFQSMHHVSKDGHNYTTTDVRDPYIIFNLDQNVSTRENSKIKIHIQCSEKLENIHIQLWWHKLGDNYFNEPNSIRLMLPPGETTIDLSSNLSWLEAEKIYRLRIDIDSDSREECRKYWFGDIEIGRTASL